MCRCNRTNAQHKTSGVPYNIRVIRRLCSEVRLYIKPALEYISYAHQGEGSAVQKYLCKTRRPCTKATQQNRHLLQCVSNRLFTKVCEPRYLATNAE